MAKQTTILNDSPREGQGRNKKARIALALTVALVSPAASMGKPCQAADFRHAKKVIVPATNIPRRYDYSSSGGRESGLPAGYESSYDSSSNSSMSSYSSVTPSTPTKVGKYGMVPPPPPVTPSLLPSSLVGDIPPPPAAPGLVSRGSSPVSPAHATDMGGYQRTSGDPTRSTSLSRHAANSKSNKTAAETSIISQVTAQSDALVKEGKLLEAQDLLEKYEKTYPKNTTLDHKLSEVSLERAKYYIRHDDYVEAAKQARVALHHNSNNTEARHALDQVLRHHGVDPNHAVSRVKMGDMLFSQGKLKEARVEYDSALKIHHSAEAYIGLGNIALRESKLKEAKAHYQLALEREPESSVALRQLGIVRYKLKDVVGANADLSRALVLNQDDKVASQTLIELWHRQVSMRPNDANSHLGLARAHQLSGDLKSAQNSYRTVVSIDPNHPNLPAARQSFKLALARQEAQKTYEAAKTLDASGAITEAYAKANESVSLSPGDVKFRLYQAELAERLGNYPDAKQLYIEVLRQDPKNIVAAQKIKSLAELLSQGDAAQSLRGPMGAAQGLLAQAGSLGTPPTVAAEQGATAGSISGLPRLRGEGPALPSLPGAPNQKMQTVDPVNSMSGFLGDLRNFMVVQKKSLQKQEDAVLDAINGPKPKSDLGGKTGALPDLPPLPSSGGDVGLPKNLISSQDVQKLLAKAGAAPSSSSAAASSSTSAGATSSQDISRLLSGSGATGSAAASAAPAIAGLAASLPSLGAAAMSALSSGKLPPGVTTEDVGRFLGSSGSSGVAPGMSGLAPANPPSSIGDADSTYRPQYSSGNSSVGDSILSTPRQSETVLKVADSSSSADTMPPVAPSRFTLPPTVSDVPQPPGAGSWNATPQTAPPMVGLAAQAQSLSPEALAGIAKSLGMEPAHVSALASQAMAQAPQLMAAAPELINKGIANLKQEDIDKMASLLKHHVALKQQAISSVHAVPTTHSTSTTPKSPPTATTKATPKLVKKVDLKKPGSSTTAKAKPPATTAIAAKPTVSPPATISTYDENALRKATGGAQTFSETSNPQPIAENGLAAASITASAVAPAAAVFVPSAISAPPPEQSQRLTSLEEQNKTLQSQLEDTQKQLQELRESLLSKPSKASKSSARKLKAANKSAKGPTVGTGSGGTSQPPSENSKAPVSGTLPPEFAPANFAPLSTPPASNATAMASAFSDPPASFSDPLVNQNLNQPNIANPIIAMAPQAQVQAPLDSSSFINLELSGINVKPRGVRLNVVLRNGTSQALNLPSKTKAVVRMVGAPDQTADVVFPVKALTPGQEAKGYISVSGHKLDPSADVFIPKLMNTETGQRDVHLTVPISALSNMSQ